MSLDELKRLSIAKPDNRTEWQHAFPWDDEVDLCNKELFMN